MGARRRQRSSPQPGLRSLHVQLHDEVLQLRLDVTCQQELRLADIAENLEAAAPKSVSLDSMLVTQEERSCLFEVIVLSGLEVESP